ncbi:MAG: C4-type zinc ribbon domain-containing protein [Actinobacteria bacterium]|nr:C4-type zinc ribbon domain-containing protein [Actinomycetota bacterium]
MGILHDLYAVQLSDIAISQAQYRLAHLPESATYQHAKSASANAITELAALDKRSAEAGAEITGLEIQAQEIDSTLARLNKQMKTIIAPREAEALQHEIATCTNNRSALDDRELELLEIVEQCDKESVVLGSRVESTRGALSSAEQALRVARATVNAQIAQLAEQRSAQSLVVSPSLLSTYDAKRKHRPDGAVSKMNGPTCSGCHLDLPKSEIDRLHKLPADELPECPHCGCFIAL